MAALLVALEGE